MEDTEVVYPAGHTVVRLDIENGIQRLLPGSLGSSSITAMATSSTKRITAFAETYVPWAACGWCWERRTFFRCRSRPLVGMRHRCRCDLAAVVLLCVSDMP